MKLNRFITNDEHARIKKLSERADLISDNKRFYYHAERMKSDSDVIFMNKLLKEVIEGFVSFSNFVEVKTNPNAGLIRIQYRWGETFTGVGFITIDELRDGFESEVTPSE